MWEPCTLSSALLAQEFRCSYLTSDSGLLWSRCKELSETFFIVIFNAFSILNIRVLDLWDFCLKCSFPCIFWQPHNLPTGRTGLSLPGLLVLITPERISFLLSLFWVWIGNFEALGVSVS